MPALACLILAAGEGKRFGSKHPKPLHYLCGRTLLDHVLAPLRELGPERLLAVVGAEQDDLQQALRERDVEIVIQQPLLGTGHATLSAEGQLAGFTGTVLVTCADIPLVSQATLQRLVDAHLTRGATATILTAIMSDPSGYGRIVRSRDGRVRTIIEHRDATDEIRQIQEVNAGIYCFHAERLFAELHHLRPDNVEGEYYLPDVIARFVAAGDVVTAVQAENADEVIGINTREELARAEHIARTRTRQRLLEAGVTLVDPTTTYVDDQVQVGQDTVIHPGSFLVGYTEVGEDCEIGPYAHLRDARIGRGVRILTGTIVERSVIEDGATVGPYSRVRDHSSVGSGAHIGNFVELVRARIGPGVRALHYAYLGDAEVGADANIGAGAITCNFDGRDKHSTHIEEGAFVGSDAILVAPVRIGAGAYVGAGSVITKDVPAKALAVARTRQKVRPNWSGPRDRTCE